MQKLRLGTPQGIRARQIVCAMLASSAVHIVFAIIAACTLIQLQTSELLHVELGSQVSESIELNVTPQAEVLPEELEIETPLEVVEVVLPSINLDLPVANPGGSEGRMSTNTRLQAMMASGLSDVGAGRGRRGVRGIGDRDGGGSFDKMVESLKQGLELVIVFDSTASMAPEIKDMKESFTKLGSQLLDTLPNTRIACVSYKDEVDAPVVEYSELTNDLYGVRKFLSKVEATGGGLDLPEAVEQGLKQAIEGYDFRPEAVKVVLLFGDAPPRQPGFETALMLARDFSMQHNCFISTISVRAKQPIPEFYYIATAGGGESMILGNRKILKELLLLIFRKTHREQAARLMHLQESQ